MEFIPTAIRMESMLSDWKGRDFLKYMRVEEMLSEQPGFYEGGLKIVAEYMNKISIVDSAEYNMIFEKPQEYEELSSL